MAVAAETLGRGFPPDHGQGSNHTGERPGLRRIAFIIGSDTFVASRPGYFRRLTPQPAGVETVSASIRPNQAPQASGR